MIFNRKLIKKIDDLERRINAIEREKIDEKHNELVEKYKNKKCTYIKHGKQQTFYIRKVQKSPNEETILLGGDHHIIWGYEHKVSLENAVISD